MESTRFDALAKALAGRRSRRTALRAGGAGLALGALGRPRTHAQQATPTAGGDEELLFVQTFASGTWTPQAGEAGVFDLTLTGSPDHTIYFANRPARDVGTLPTAEFFDFLGFDPADPPNAALVVQAEAGEDVLVVELLDPRLEAGTLTYAARPLAEYQGQVLAGLAAWQGDQVLPEQFGSGSLFIDARRRPRPLTCQQQPGDVCNLGPGNLCNVANNCRCGSSVEGVGVCVVGAPNFCTRRTCFSSRDCASDSVCVLAGSCCGAGASVCMRVCPAG